MALDYWIAVRRGMVVQEATRVFSPSRMAWSTWMVACLTICSCRFVSFFLVLLHYTIPSVHAMWPSYEQPYVERHGVSNTRESIGSRTLFFGSLSFSELIGELAFFATIF